LSAATATGFFWGHCRYWRCSNETAKGVGGATRPHQHNGLPKARRGRRFSRSARA
jgi:hypothetical protein